MVAMETEVSRQSKLKDTQVNNVNNNTRIECQKKQFQAYSCLLNKLDPSNWISFLPFLQEAQVYCKARQIYYFREKIEGIEGFIKLLTEMFQKDF